MMFMGAFDGVRVAESRGLGGIDWQCKWVGVRRDGSGWQILAPRPR